MDLYTVVDVITKGLTINLVVSIGIYGYFFLHQYPIHKGMGDYMLACLVFDICSYVCGKYLGYNHFLIPLFGLAEFVLLIRVFLTIQKKKQVHYSSFLWVYILLVVLELFLLIFKTTFLPIPSRSLGYAFLLWILKKYILTATYVEIEKFRGLLFFILFYASFSCVYYLLLTFSVYWNNDLKFTLWLLHSLVLHVLYATVTCYQINRGKIL
jgi:hypothetical protein